jgi:hypothetical protein
MGNGGKELKGDGRAASGWVLKYETHKSERAISLARTRPLYSDFSEIRFGFQITTLVTPESFGNPRATARVFTSFFYDHTRCKNFPAAVRFQLPGLSLVAESRRRLSVRSLLWKIALPLKAILLSSDGSASASGNFLLWKLRYEKWKFLS